MRTARSMLAVALLLGSTAPVAAGRLWGDCSRDYTSCSDGACYELIPGYGQCRPHCNNATEDWSCTTLGLPSAQAIVAGMGVGWNLGNALDALGGETNWGNPVTTKAMIDGVRNKGFQTLRVPVSWDDYTGPAPTFTIQESWLDRVEEVANYGLDNDMYVIVDIHHTTGWEEISKDNEAAATDRLEKLWAQIAPRFAKYGPRLILETMNEPRTKLPADDWWGGQEQFDIVSRMNAAALRVIRSTGGYNADRLVMMPGYVAGGNAHQLDGLTLPADRMIALSVHSYFPFSFSFEKTGHTVFDDTSSIDELVQNLQSKILAKGVPVVMGEFATNNKENTAERVKHASYYVKALKSIGVPAIVWDNGNPTAFTSDAMGIYDRRHQTWWFPQVADAIVNA